MKKNKKNAATPCFFPLIIHFFHFRLHTSLPFHHALYAAPPPAAAAAPPPAAPPPTGE